MSRFPSAASIAGTVLIALGAFWLSFTALRDLADRSGVPASQSWVWPLIVDGLVLVATVAVVALDEHRWYAWSLLATGAVISLAGNTLHATYTGDLPLAVRVLVAAVPPLSLLAVTHLTYLLVTRRAPVSESNTVPRPAPLITVTDRSDTAVADLTSSFRDARNAPAA